MIERIDDEDEMMRLSARLGAGAVIGELVATEFPLTNLPALSASPLASAGEIGRNVIGDPMVAATAARRIRIVHHDGKTFALGWRVGPRQRRRNVLPAACPGTAQALAGGGIVLAQHAVVGEVGRGQLEQVRMIDSSRAGTPGQVRCRRKADRGERERRDALSRPQPPLSPRRLCGPSWPPERRKQAQPLRAACQFRRCRENDRSAPGVCDEETAAGRRQVERQGAQAGAASARGHGTRLPGS